MNSMKKLVVAVFAVAGMSGCATTQTAEVRDAQEAAPAAPETRKVSMPTNSYGSLGGYRYRRFVAVNAPAS